MTTSFNDNDITIPRRKCNSFVVKKSLNELKIFSHVMCVIMLFVLLIQFLKDSSNIDLQIYTLKQIFYISYVNVAL